MKVPTGTKVEVGFLLSAFSSLVVLRFMKCFCPVNLFSEFIEILLELLVIPSGLHQQERFCVAFNLVTSLLILNSRVFVNELKSCQSQYRSLGYPHCFLLLSIIFIISVFRVFQPMCKQVMAIHLYTLQISHFTFRLQTCI